MAIAAYNDDARLTAATEFIGPTAQLECPITAYWQCVTYGNGVFSALAGGTGHAAYSPNGMVWSNATGLPSANWGGMAFGNGIFVAVAYDSDIAAYSSNGIVWNSSTNAANALWYSTAFANGLFVAPAIGSTNASFSTNGINWNSSASPLPDQDTFYTVSGNNRFKPPATSRRIVAYWTLNDGSGTTADRLQRQRSTCRCSMGHIIGGRIT